MSFFFKLASFDPFFFRLARWLAATFSTQMQPSAAASGNWHISSWTKRPWCFVGRRWLPGTPSWVVCQKRLNGKDFSESLKIWRLTTSLLTLSATIPASVASVALVASEKRVNGIWPCIFWTKQRSCWISKQLGFVLWLIFYGFGSHGIHHHGRPFGRLCLDLFFHLGLFCEKKMKVLGNLAIRAKKKNTKSCHPWFSQFFEQSRRFSGGWCGLFTSYCWWKKSQTTTWDVKNLVNDGINYLSAWFLPTTWEIKITIRGICFWGWLGKRHYTFGMLCQVALATTLSCHTFGAPFPEK